MLARDRDALFCDLAETYHVFGFDRLPARQLAALAAGLRPDSRIMRAFSGARYSMAELLLAACLDRLSLLFWAETKDGQKNRKRPQSLAERMLRPQETRRARGFDSEEAFEEARRSFFVKAGDSS